MRRISTQASLRCLRMPVGRACYMAARAGADFLLDFNRMTAPQAGAAPCIRAELPSGVTANCREKGETDYLFLQN